MTWSRVLAIVVGTAAFALLIYELGFSGEVTLWSHWGTWGAGVLFLLDLVQRFRVKSFDDLEKRRRGILMVEAFFVAGGLIGIEVLRAIQYRNERLDLLLHALIQSTIFLTYTIRMLKVQAKVTALTLRPGWLLIGSFSLIILVGACLLKLPRAVEEGFSLTWTDALFTSTSAVCVTGLTLHNTAEFFTPTGQIIILGLFQTGGLGIMTLTFFMATWLFQGMSLHDRFLLGEMIAEKRLAHVGETLRFIINFTLIVEAMGALAIFLVFPWNYPWDERLFHAVFHSISAFCNAGFTTLPKGLADPWLQDRSSLQLFLACLSIAGAMGSMVAFDLIAYCKQRWKKCWVPDTQRPRLRVHTRLVVWITAGVVVVGTPLFYLSEFAGDRLSHVASPWMTSVFYASTARVAGFSTIETVNVTPLAIHCLVFLMLIGGSPGGTGGGLRTTVLAVAALHLWNQLRNLPTTVLFKRHLPQEFGSRALGIIVLAMGWLFLNFTLLRHLQPKATDTELVFELVSAFATVGLSLDLTPELSAGAKWVILVNMFVGRIGLLTVLVTLIPVGRRSKHTYPDEEILLF